MNVRFTPLKRELSITAPPPEAVALLEVKMQSSMEMELFSLTKRQPVSSAPFLSKTEVLSEMMDACPFNTALVPPRLFRKEHPFTVATVPSRKKPAVVSASLDVFTRLPSRTEFVKDSVPFTVRSRVPSLSVALMPSAVVCAPDGAWKMKDSGSRLSASLLLLISTSLSVLFRERTAPPMAP